MNVKHGIQSLAKNSARHPWVTIGIWIGALTVSCLLITSLLGGALTTENDITNNPESRQANTLIKERLERTDPTTIEEMLIVKSAAMTVDDPVYQAEVEGLFGSILNLGPDVVTGGVTYYLTGDETLVSSDRHSMLIPLVMPKGSEDRIDQIYALGDAVTLNHNVAVFYTGDASFTADTTQLAEETMSKGETTGIMVALVVLAVVFGALVAATLPVILGIIAVVAALGMVSLIGQAMQLSFFTTNMVTMMGLAVGIDYSLFIVTRFREERKRGFSKTDAIAVTGATANQAIFFSGMTVILSLLSLLIFPLAIFKSMGIGSIVVVFTAVIASMTLLPAVLSLLGDRIDAPRFRFGKSRKPAQAAGSAPGGFWAGVTRLVTRRPAVSLVLTVAVLILALTPYFDKNTGMSGISGLPDDLRAKQGFMMLVKEFHIGMDAPAVIVVDGDVNDPVTQAAIARLSEIVSTDPVFAATSVESYADKNLAIVYAALSGDPMTKQSLDAVDRLRSTYLPEAFSGSPVRTLVTGSTAVILDFNQTTDEYTPIVFGIVLSLSFVILTLAFRSIVIPATAILMNLLSVGASYGLTVLVFQKGVGASLFGFQQVDVIESWLPLFMFALLFGLSMDYHVFLLSRIREHYVKSGDNTASVAFGLRSTGKLITGAALIMVAVFGGFALGDMVMFQQMGFGLAVAVFIDATLVRTILVPATMDLLGKLNWYMPKWLNWLPNISLGEGNETIAGEGMKRPDIKITDTDNPIPVLVPLLQPSVELNRPDNEKYRN